MNTQEAQNLWASHRGKMRERGIVLPDVTSYATEDMKRDYTIAMDALPPGALPSLNTTPNSAIPAILTTYVDLEPIRIAFAPTNGAKIAGERKMGDWTMDTAMFNVIEPTGETSAYGDFAENGRSGINQNFPQRQSFHFQVMEEYGERELERADLTKIGYVSEVNRASAENLNRFLNYSYFFGIQGLQNYGLVNDPALGASLTPGTKIAGNGNVWINSTTGIINGTANEIFLDIQAMVWQLMSTSAGLVDESSEMIMGLAPGVSLALTATNAFGITVKDMMKNSFPNMRVETAVQYGQTSSTNPQGIAAGNLVQLIARSISGVDSVFCSFTEKMRAHKLVVATSSYKRKVTSGTWGTVWRYPGIANATMLGV